MKFPRLIHVTEEHPEHDDPYFVVNPKGVAGLDENGHAVAIYRLVVVGRVQITKAFVATRVTRPKRRRG